MKENETENMLNVLINDNIQRNDLLLSFTNFILATANGVIAIDGKWGSGKTFFVRQLHFLINYLNNYDENGRIKNKEMYTNNLLNLENVSHDIKNNLIEFMKTIRNDPRLSNLKSVNCIYFNAWEYENNTEPILSLVYKIINDFPYLTAKMEQAKIDLVTGTLDAISNFLFKGNINLSNCTSKKNLLENIITSEEARFKINKLFEDLLHENCNKMVIVIDELDRCNPAYAIKLLEEIKHYINSENITIIISTNLYQVSNSIKNLYGYNFDVESYLDKTIDITFELPPINKEYYLQSLLPGYDSSGFFERVIINYINCYGLEMRSINKYVNLMKLYQKHMNNDKFRKINYVLDFMFLPYILGQRLFRIKDYSEFVGGTGFEEFKKFILYSKNTHFLIRSYIHPNENISIDTILVDLKKIYNFLYNQDKEVSKIIVGQAAFESYQRDAFLMICTVFKSLNIK